MRVEEVAHAHIGMLVAVSLSRDKTDFNDLTGEVELMKCRSLQVLLCNHDMGLTLWCDRHKHLSTG